MHDSALILVDVQNDFCPGGALPVPLGDQVVEPLNRAITYLEQRGGLCCASRDWHPRTTSHFAESGGVWPVHCVQDSAGAQFHPQLHLSEQTVILSKGMGCDEDAYSAFDASTAEGLTLAEVLCQRDIRHLWVGGLATDYCVQATVLDGLRHGFAVTLLSDATAGVEVNAGDTARAVAAMVAAGAGCCMVDELREG